MPNLAPSIVSAKSRLRARIVLTDVAWAVDAFALALARSASASSAESTLSDRSFSREDPHLRASLAAPAPAVPQSNTAFTSTWTIRPTSKASGPRCRVRLKLNLTDHEPACGLPQNGARPRGRVQPPVVRVRPNLIGQ